MALGQDLGTRGQVLVFVALAMVALVAMVGLVIDGGYAWGRQRDTQNGADAVAKAGTVFVQHELAEPGSVTDWNVACAVEAAAAANQVALDLAEYTDFNGDLLTPSVTVGTCGASDPGVAIPAAAQGVRATASETFDTFLMQVIGFDTLTATANATAVVGTPEGIPGGALPITFPENFNICDASDDSYVIRKDDGGGWEPYEILEDESEAATSNLAIVPLCDIEPGSVGWLDYDCGQNLANSIEQPCDSFIYIPDWIHAQTGNPNSVEDELNEYAGSIVGTPEGEIFGTVDTDAVLALPIHRNTCFSDPNEGDAPGTHTEPCPDGPWSGAVGDNNYYDVHFWVGFKLDRAYTQGADVECRQAPGTPQLDHPEPPGKVGCLKGWFVDYIGEPGSIRLGPINPGDPVLMSIALIN